MQQSTKNIRYVCETKKYFVGSTKKYYLCSPIRKGATDKAAISLTYSDTSPHGRRNKHIYKGIRMYAIVEMLGQQFKVEVGQRVFVHRMNEAERGSNVEFDSVLLVDKDGIVTVGTPTVSGAKVKAEVISHLRGDKVLVFKKKRRKGYRKLNGHRQDLTEIVIKEITA